MWGSNDESMIGDNGAGAFFNTTRTPDASSKKQDTKRGQSVTPVVIQMLKNCQEDDFTMWGNPTSILKLVCIVRKFDVTSTTVTYDLEDSTGKMKAILWLEHDATSKPDIPVDKENVYVRIFGTLRSKNDEKVLMILRIAPIDTYNEVITHQLEVVYVRLMQEMKSKGDAITIQANNPGAELINSMMTFAGGDMDEEGMTPVQRNVFRYLKTHNSEIGIDRKEILEGVPQNQRKDVNAALAFLVSEGHIFSTIDADHFQLTNSV